MSDQSLSFTGERFLPECEREIWYEHYHRYSMIRSLVAGKSVLDAACGEGYGSALLASSAEQVTGIDISRAAIAHAKTTYQQANLRFKQSDVLDIDVPDGSFDVVVSFETLEHLAAHDELMQSFKRVLKPGGTLVISSPDKAEYSDKTGFNNEFHVKELYRNEFEDLINRYYKNARWFGQKLMFTSQLWELERPLSTCQFDCMTAENSVIDTPPFVPMYYVVVASDQALDQSQLKSLYTFTEQQETVYGHYNAVIRAHIDYENKYNHLHRQQQTWLNHPIIGRCIKWFSKD